MQEETLRSGSHYEEFILHLKICVIILYMLKKYLKKSVKCPLCNKNTRRLVEYQNQMICNDCFLSISTKEFVEKNPNYSKTLKKRKLFKPIKAPGKSIYAINGVVSVYRGGCTN